jgi:hypothetical protein
MTKGFELGRLKVLSLALIASCASGQWLNYPTPGIPRLPDGKPNLAAPAQKATDGKPDLSGVWTINAAANPASLLKPGDAQPWAEALTKERQENLGKDNPSSVHCLPFGPGFASATNFLKIVQTPALIVILSEDLTYRQIFLDGRDLPAAPNPDFMGYSVGHWEGDTLVVATAGYNDPTWLDNAGHPHTEALRTVEWFRRRDFGHLEITETFDDPNAFVRPWTVNATGNLTPDSDLLEYVCNENNKDIAHLVGKASDQKGVAVEVAAEILARYAAVFAGTLPSGRPIRLEIFPVGRELWFSRDGGARQLLTPVANTKFLAPAGPQLEFFEENGEIVALQFYGVGFDTWLLRVRDGN